MLSNTLLSPPLSLLSPSHPQNLNTKKFKLSSSSSSSSTSHFNSLIKTHIESHQPKQALSLFHQLLSHPFLIPDSFTYPLALKACAHLSSLKQTQQIHSLILKSNHIDVFVCTSLLNAYAECGNIDNARKVFDTMPDRSIVTWNCMLSGFFKCGDLSSAVECFDGMPVRNVVSWNSLIRGYVKAGMSHEALMVLLEMRASGLEPDETTMVSVVSAVSELGLLDLGRRAHGYVVRRELSLNGALGVALITLYGKFGVIGAAYEVFLTIRAKNVNHWTSMIGEFANHGLTENSRRVFSEMLNLGIKPNHVTFVGVLNACRHAGLAEEGLKYFNLMKIFDIEPRVEHYGCLIDLLGRCGHVDEALKIACNSLMDPGVVIWGTLLAACENHGNVEIAEIVAKKLIELEPIHGSSYVLLSNLYVKKKRWEDSKKMRKLMEERRVVKVAGLSWIEVNGKVHEFVAGDKFHAKAKEIYGILEHMKGNLRWAGYEPVACTVEGIIEEGEDLSIEDR